MGFFIAGGNTGFFLGPIVAGALLTVYGLHGTLLLLPVGLIVALILLRARVTAGTPTAIAETNVARPVAVDLRSLCRIATANFEY